MKGIFKNLLFLFTFSTFSWFEIKYSRFETPTVFATQKITNIE